MIPSNQLAITHKKHLNNCILFSQIKAFIHITRYDISVFFSICCNLLPLADLLDTSYQISSFCSILKAHFFRCFLHFFSKLIDRFLKIPVQKTNDLLDIFFIGTLIRMSGTRTHALFHVIIQAWTVLSTVSRKVSITGTHLI